MLKNILLELLYIPCARFRWYRRWAGGHWERWYVDYPVCGDYWFRTDGCYLKRETRPGLCRVLHKCEDYPERAV